MLHRRFISYCQRLQVGFGRDCTGNEDEAEKDPRRGESAVVHFH